MVSLVGLSAERRRRVRSRDTVPGMTYPAPFHRIVILGTLYTDIFNTTLSMVPNAGTLPAATQSLADDLDTFLASWWDNDLADFPTAGGLAFSVHAKYTGVKVNRIGTDGRYEDAEAIEKVHSAPVSGINSTLSPAQNATVGTLRGADPRARAGKGRQYWPPNGSFAFMGSDGRISAAGAAKVANGLHSLYAGINDVYLAHSISSIVGIASDVGTGAFQTLNEITVGRTIDTVRSRRNKIPEDFVSLPFS